MVSRKPTKTISGVAPLSVMIPPRRCDHGACLYCPTLKAPQSYTPESPAVLRARACGYDPYKQVLARLRTLGEMGHPTDKVELIIMGGTFLSFPRKFQFDFVKRCYDALNGVDSDSLDEAKRVNESALHRCVALCIETRPDVCSDDHVRDILSWGATRVELGVQVLDDVIYKRINRCHGVQEVVDATARLKRAGFKLGYHIMPGLPGSSVAHDISLYKLMFSDERFIPDQVKIYPCQVLKGAGLEQLYFGREYLPYSRDLTKEVILEMLKLTPRFCRVMRIMREIPPAYLVAGVTNLDMRHDIERELRKQGAVLDEIRFREIGFALRDGRSVDPEVSLKVTSYRSSGGKEFFVEAVNSDDVLFGLVRLRLEDDSSIPAMVRELHVYGPTLNLGEKAVMEWQHRGLGKRLMEKAEEIAKGDGRSMIRVISGIGVREYYKKLGYVVDKDNVYVEKVL